MKRKLSIGLAIAITLLIATRLVYTTQAQDSPEYTFESDEVQDNCRNEPGFDIIRLDAQTDGKLEISKCDGTPFNQPGTYKVWVNTDADPDFDFEYASGSYSNTIGTVITVDLDPVADENLYGPHDYRVDLRSNDQPSIPKYSGTIRMWEEYVVPAPVQTHDYQISPSIPQCGNIVALELKDNDQQLDVNITKCDRSEFIEGGIFYIEIEGPAASPIPRWGPFEYSSGVRTISETIDPASMGLTGPLSYQARVYSADQPTLEKISGSVNARAIPRPPTPTPTPTPEPAVGINKSVSNRTAEPGSSLTYRIEMSATQGTINVSMEDVIPLGLTVDPMSVMGGTFANGKVIYDGPVSSGGVIITYQATVNADVEPPATLINTATVNWNGEAATAETSVSVPDTIFTGSLVLISVSAENDLCNDVPKLFNRAEGVADNNDVEIFVVFDGPGRNNCREVGYTLGTDDSYLYHLRYNDLADLDDCPSQQDFICGQYTLVETGQLNRGERRKWSEGTGTPDNLEVFVTSHMLAYPNARQVILSLVGHGSGWTAKEIAGQPIRPGSQPGGGGLLLDLNPRSSLSTFDLGQALNAVKEATGRKVDLLYLDACLMAMGEVAYEVKDSVQYFLASANWKWAIFPYDKHLSILDETITPVEVGRQWLEHEVQEATELRYPFTFSLIDASNMTNVKDALDELAIALITAINTDKDKIHQAFQQTDCFDENQDILIDEKDSYCDLGSFVDHLETVFGATASPALVAAIAQVRETLTTQDAENQVIVSEAHQSGSPWVSEGEHWHWGELYGLSIYMPLGEDEAKRGLYNQLQLSESAWLNFLNAYWEYADPPPFENCPNESCPFPPGQLPVETDFASMDAFISAASEEALTLAWTAPAPEISIGAYQVLRQYQRNPFVEITSIISSSTVYTDTELLAIGTSYCYRVWGLDNFGSPVAVLNITCSPAYGVLTLSIPDRLSIEEDDREVMVPFTLMNADGLCLRAFNIEINYDPTVLRAQHRFDLFLDGFRSNIDRPEGKVRIAAFSEEGCQSITGTHRLLNLTFRKLVDNGYTAIEIVDDPKDTAFYSDLNDQPIAIEFDNGSVKVGDGINSLISGDVTGDGNVDSADAHTAILIASGQIAEPTSAQIIACDVRKERWLEDTEPDDRRRCRSGDATKILCYVVRRSWDRCTRNSSARSLDLQTQSIQVWLPEPPETDDSTFTMPIHLRGGSQIFAGGDFIVRYDPSQMTLQNISRPDLTQDFLLAYSENQPGHIQIAMASDRPILNDGAILNLTFTKIGTTVSPVSFEQLYLNDEFGNDFEMELNRPVEASPMFQLPIQIYMPIVRN